ncbi:MAG: dihydropteroate synthase [Acidimicrobiales bacterium]
MTRPRPLVMGVLNVTPDSFFDGGLFFDDDAAIARGLDMIEEGADIVDIGGESSRPGAQPIAVGEEMRRVMPVVEALSSRVRVSIDTAKADVARAAVRAGASIVNDITASLAEVAAGEGVGWIAVHMQGDPATMQLHPRYDDVVSEVEQYLAEQAEWASALGVPEVWIDPGIGFGKTLEHNLALLHRLDTLVGTGYPVTVGVSRKGFIGRLVSGDRESPAPVSERLEGSLSLGVWAMANGASMIRAHDVRETFEAAVLFGGTVEGLDECEVMSCRA